MKQANHSAGAMQLVQRERMEEAEGLEDEKTTLMEVEQVAQDR